MKYQKSFGNYNKTKYIRSIMFEKEYSTPESRKLEFKETLPSGDKIERTAVAFSNDAGGDIYIGIKNDPREVTGIPENELIKLEEQISNIIYDNCNPTILPDILVQKVEDKYIIVVKIPRGSLPPYYINHLVKKMEHLFVSAHQIGLQTEK